MPIVAADLEYRRSVTTGPGDSTAQADPGLSLGDFMSTTVIPETLNGLFDDVSGAENAASDVEYRCLFVYNSHATLTLQASAVWMAAEVAGGTSVAIALDATGVVSGTLATAQAQEIADEGTAPTGLTFASPTTEGAALTVGDIPAGSCQAIWVRRTAADTAAISGDGVTLRIKGDTAA